MIRQDDLPGPNEPLDFPPTCDGGEHCRLATIAENEFHNRRRRDSLDRPRHLRRARAGHAAPLYVEHHRGRAVAAERLCSSAGVATATAMRWIGLLIENKLVRAVPASTGDAEVEIALSPYGAEEMERYLRDHLHRERLGGVATGLHER
jgi:hypothetical protein